MYTGYTIWQKREASAHLSIHVRSYLLHHASPFNQPSVQPLINVSTSISYCVVGECALLIPLSRLSQKGQACWPMQRGRGVFGRASPGGRQWRINKKDPKLQESTGAINCQGSVGFQCPLCRWGISCWWPATDPHTPDGTGACMVISCRYKRDKVLILNEIKDFNSSSDIVTHCALNVIYVHDCISWG